MHIVELIAKKRDGHALSKTEINYIISNYTKGLIADYQMSALTMAILLKGMTDQEATDLALAIRDSGEIIDLSLINGVKVDKHSTGGVGDKVTLVLGPLLASFGVKFAKMSGRGLGHTGGTVDKLESIPGFQVELSKQQFIDQVNQIDIAVIGQSGDIAPADKKLYALRDVTATVESIPLIASSVMSKKLASGADAICLDVKVGNGAFMKTKKDAKHLAKVMVSIGRLAGKQMTAVLTTMDEPLGHKIGNLLEVIEAIETLRGYGPDDLVEVTVEIGAHLLLAAEKETDLDVAKKRLHDALSDGSAYSKMKELIGAQGGDLDQLDHLADYLAKQKVLIYASKSGYIEKMKAIDLGRAAMRLGAGRETKEDQIDYSVGIDLHAKIGDLVQKGDVIATLYVADKDFLEAKSLVEKAIQIGPKLRKIPRILETIH